MKPMWVATLVLSSTFAVGAPRAVLAEDGPARRSASAGNEPQPSCPVLRRDRRPVNGTNDPKACEVARPRPGASTTGAADQGS